jgi:nucleoside-diphosphate-sugar epimerase
MPPCLPLPAFSEHPWDAIINFVGVGDPARAIAMGADILNITRAWDDRVMEYLDANPACRYIFLSSGAAFGSGHDDAMDDRTVARFPLNALQPSACYGISKFYAEAVHRSRPDRSILDVRIFNYLSNAADLSHRFLVNEVLAAIRDRRTLQVDPNDLWRDYLGTSDLAGLMAACLRAPEGSNAALDAYSRAPISKMAMLDFFKDAFGLSFEVGQGGINATGTKSLYFSRNRIAEAYGYHPVHGSIDTLRSVATHILAQT